jgi:hypothetical protein
LTALTDEKADPEEADKNRVTKPRIWGIISGLMIAIAILVWACWLFGRSPIDAPTSGADADRANARTTPVAP